MLSYLGYKLVQGLFRLLPIQLLYPLSSVLSWTLQHLIGYRSATIDKNLALAYPKQSSLELGRIKKKFYKNLADTGLETLIGPYLEKEKLKERMFFKNPELIPENGFVLLIGGHQGNWEWGGLAVNLWLQQKVFGVYKPMKNKFIDRNFKNDRKKWGLNLLSMRETNRWLVSNPTSAVLVLIADQSPGNAKTSVWTTFHNRETCFNVGPEKIAKRMNCPVYFYSVKRVARGKYEVEFSELENNPKDTMPGAITVAFKNALEKSIDEQPEDWLWSHKRWKKKKPSDVKVYN